MVGVSNRNLVFAGILVTLLLASTFLAFPVFAQGPPAGKGPGDLERVDFIHYFKAKGNGNPVKADSTCYKLMGVKWGGLPVSYAINTNNPQGLSASFIMDAISTSAETWDAATSKELFSNSYSVDTSAQYRVLDGKNAIAFGNYGSSNVIAVTSVWYNRFTKRIVEFDQLYNTQYTWGDATSNSNVMDLQNIATHELGHAVGLGDIYSGSCLYVTMYGYSGYGDIEKRSLASPDIAGLHKMYGT